MPKKTDYRHGDWGLSGFGARFSSCKIRVSGVMLSLTNDVVDWDKCVLSSVER